MNAMSSTRLQEMARVATMYETVVVRSVLLDLFIDAATGMCSPEQFESAEQFFGWLIKGMNREATGKLPSGNAKSLIMRWLPTTDPLRIADDPECGYGPVSSVN